MELRAADFMTRDVISVSPDTSLREAAELVAENRISGVPVVESDGTVVGILSESDLLDEEKRHVKLPRTALFGLFPIPEHVLKEAFEGGDLLKVRDLMSTHVFTLPEDAPAQQIVEEMLTRKVNRIPITRDGKLVGIVARSDALRALVTRLGVPKVPG